MKRLNFILLALLLVLSYGAWHRVHGQQAVGQVTPVQQTTTRADAAIQVCTVAASATACTLTPPNGQYVYITGVDISNCGDATGVTAAATTTITTTNLGGLTWTMGSVTGAGACINPPLPYFGPGGLRGAAPGTNVVFTLPTFATHQTIRLNAYYFYAF